MICGGSSSRGAGGHSRRGPWRQPQPRPSAAGIPRKSSGFGRERAVALPLSELKSARCSGECALRLPAWAFPPGARAGSQHGRHAKQNTLPPDACRPHSAVLGLPDTGHRASRARWAVSVSCGVLCSETSRPHCPARGPQARGIPSVKRGAGPGWGVLLKTLLEWLWKSSSRLLQELLI